VQFCFLLGPAGTGKTFRCLHEIRNELVAHPEGPPLIFLAPKQSTYQLERQLLESGRLSGYSRLHVLSFERLARFVFSELRQSLPAFLSEQGRTMVLRALLGRCSDQLTIFRNAARHGGFAEELSTQIREFQNHGLGPAAVRKLAARSSANSRLNQKLSDLALLYEQYLAWLEKESLRDADALLTAAAELLVPGTQLRIGGLWFDGFAQLTPQELQLLAAVLRFSKRATLAFCLEEEKRPDSAISPWFIVSQTYHRCRAALEQYHGRAALRVEFLRRDERTSRFACAPALRHLEGHWNTPEPFVESQASASLTDKEFPNSYVTDSIQVIQAADPESECVFAAREILKFVRAGGRYREAALLLRSFQNDYPHLLRRVFRRYGIPFFLDHRESVAHHPMAELTRGALRTIGFHWKHQDWFATLKCGLVRFPSEDLDELENHALAHGWDAAAWRQGFNIPRDASLEKRLNRERVRLLEPFAALEKTLGQTPDARAVAQGIRALWDELSVEEQLESWTREDPGCALHSTVWDQMLAWLDDLTLAFSGQRLPLSAWLPILEAGLQNLTVGVVPPVLDQVLIGSVDRSRNPDLKLVFVLGLNERVFPAAPARDTLLAEDDRYALLNYGCTLSEIPSLRVAAEQFYGYVACTRPRERLCLSFARTAMDGAQQNPSRFITQIERLFPALQREFFHAPATAEDLVHTCEFAALGIPLPFDSPHLAAPDQSEKLDPSLAERLYGPELKVAVSSLEHFASCPFQFFARHGLDLKERDEFHLDIREQGSFQHEVLAQFHEELAAESLHWRDVTPQEARERIGRIADALTVSFKGGLLAVTEQNRYTAENYKKSLQEFIAVVVEWFQTNKFDPARVEFGFGRDSDLPGWQVPLENGRALILHGRLDRIDLYRISETEACCVIIDYKSGLQKPDRVLLHYGVQQQLPAYLLAVTQIPRIAAHLGFEKLTAAGCFLIPLGARYDRGKNRREVLGDPHVRRSAYTHGGIFDFKYLEWLDSTAPDGKSGQFDFRLNNDGSPHGNSFNALDSARFQAVLQHSEHLMRDFGQRIYSGDISIHPFKKGSVTACDKCHFQSICRFDAWTQKFNTLRAAETSKSL
jgi:ATP-dependent helicase/nuclease subunit B